MLIPKVSKRATGVTSRPLNCAHHADFDKGKRCPYCNQFHLREGYCQALDPINLEKYPGIWDGSIAITVAHLRDPAAFSRDFARYGTVLSVTVVDSSCQVPISHRAETDTLNSESLENKDFGAHSATYESEVCSQSTPIGSNVCTDEPHDLKNCVECGKGFKLKRADSIFCSPDCRLKNQRRKKREAELGE